MNIGAILSSNFQRGKSLIPGVHIKRSNEMLKNISSIYKKSKISCIQIFLENPYKRTGKFSKEKREELQNIKILCNELKINIYVHAPYTINISQEITNIKSQEYDWHIKSLIKEIQMANEFNVKGVVLHVGKYLTLTEKKGIKNMKLSLNIIYNNIQNCSTDLYLETPAGQGTEVLSNINDFIDFYASLSLNIRKKVFICIDTCHIFSAGYDIRDKKNIDLLFNTIDKKIGIESIKLIHLNDSATPFNSRVDRHEAIGKGSIGIVALKYFFKKTQEYNIPVILETPNNNPEKDISLLI